MSDIVELGGDASSLVRALEQASAAFIEFDRSTTRITRDLANFDAAGTIVSRTIQAVDVAGNQLNRTFIRTEEGIRVATSAIKAVENNLANLVTTVEAAAAAQELLARAANQATTATATQRSISASAILALEEQAIAARAAADQYASYVETIRVSGAAATSVQGKLATLNQEALTAEVALREAAAVAANNQAAALDRVAAAGQRAAGRGVTGAPGRIPVLTPPTPEEAARQLKTAAGATLFGGTLQIEAEGARRAAQRDRITALREQGKAELAAQKVSREEARKTADREIAERRRVTEARQRDARLIEEERRTANAKALEALKNELRQEEQATRASAKRQAEAYQEKQKRKKALEEQILLDLKVELAREEQETIRSAKRQAAAYQEKAEAQYAAEQKVLLDLKVELARQEQAVIASAKRQAAVYREAQAARGRGVLAEALPTRQVGLDFKTIAEGGKATEQQVKAFLRAETAVKKLVATGTVGFREMSASIQQARSGTLQLANATTQAQQAAYKLAVAERQVAAGAKEATVEAKGLAAAVVGLGRIVGISLLIGAVFRLVTALTEGTRAAIEFEKAIAEIQTIDRARVATDTWIDSLRELSDSFGIQVTEQAEAAYQALSNQIATGVTVTNFLIASNKLAVTAVTDTATATNLLTAALNSFRIDASRSEEVAAKLFKVVELGRVRIDDMAESFGRLSVPAKQLGITLDELGAAIAVTTIQGVKYNEASTLIRNVILKLIRPTDALKALFNEIGVESGQAAIETFGFGGLLKILEERTQGSATELGRLFGRIRAITGALVFAGDGVEKFDAALGKIQATNLDTFAANTALVLENVGKQLEIEVEKIRNFFKVDIGRDALNFIKGVNDAIGGFSNRLKDAARVIKFTAIPLTALLTIRLLAYTTAAIQARIATQGLLAALGGPWGIATIAITGVATAIALLKDEAETATERSQRLSDELSKNISERANADNKAIADSLDQTQKLLRKRTQLFAQPIATNLLQPLNKEFEELSKNFKTIDKSIQEVIKNTIEYVKTLVSESEGQFNKFKSRAESIGEVIDGLFVQRDATIFNLRLEGAKNVQTQLRVIADHIEELEKVRKVAVRTGDLDTFNRINKELKDLQLKRGDILRTTNKQLTEDTRRAQKIEQIIRLTEEEAKLRRQIAEDDRIRALATEKVLTLQRLALKDLEEAFKGFKAKDFREALGGDDPSEIRRTLALREESAKRLAILQQEVGIQRVKETDIERQIIQDRITAENRIAAIKQKAIIEERRENAKRLEATSKAIEAEIKNQQENLDLAAKRLDDFRKLVSEIKVFEDDPISDLENRLRDPLIRLFKSIGITITEELVDQFNLKTPSARPASPVFGQIERSEAQKLLPALERLEKAFALSPDKIGAATLKAIESDRQLVVQTTTRLLKEFTDDSITKQREFVRSVIKNIAEQRGLGASETADLLVGLEEQFKKADATVGIFEQILSDLGDEGKTTLDIQKSLNQARERFLANQKKIQELQDINLKQGNEQEETLDVLIHKEKELADAIKIGERQAAGEFSFDQQLQDAVISTQTQWNDVFQAAVESTRQAQVDNATAAETAKKEITAKSIRDELEARYQTERKRQQERDKRSRLGPGAAERAALLDSTLSGSARRKAIAEARAKDREAKREEAIKIQNEKLREAAKAREELAKARGESGEEAKALATAFPELAKTEQDARQDLVDTFPELVKGELDARKALIDQLREQAGTFSGGLRPDYTGTQAAPAPQLGPEADLDVLSERTIVGAAAQRQEEILNELDRKKEIQFQDARMLVKNAIITGNITTGVATPQPGFVSQVEPMGTVRPREQTASASTTNNNNSRYTVNVYGSEPGEIARKVGEQLQRWARRGVWRSP